MSNVNYLRNGIEMYTNIATYTLGQKLKHMKYLMKANDNENLNQLVLWHIAYGNIICFNR